MRGATNTLRLLLLVVVGWLVFVSNDVLFSAAHRCSFSVSLCKQRDADLAAYDKHLQSEAAPPPLTAEEVEKEEIRQAEVCLDAACVRASVRLFAF